MLQYFRLLKDMYVTPENVPAKVEGSSAGDEQDNCEIANTIVLQWFSEGLRALVTGNQGAFPSGEAEVQQGIHREFFTPV